MATKEFKLPDVGEGVAEGELVQWLVEPGDAVSEDQPVAEVETDKALVEVPSPYDGTVKELLAEEGEMVPVGEVIITFEVDEGEVEGDEPDAGEAGEGAEPEPAEPADAGSEAGESAEAGGTTEETAEAEQATADGRVFAAPSARRLARELGVDIASVEGSGPGGRVTEADIRAAEDGEAAAVGAAEGGDTGSEPEGPREVGGGEPTVTRRGEAGDGETPSGSAAAADTSEAADRDRTLAAPATRRKAEELGVNIDEVPATEERDGEAFVTAEAIEQYAEAQREAQRADAEAVSAGAGAGAAAEPEAATATATATGTGAESAETAAAEAAGEAAVTRRGEAGDGRERRVPYRGIRRTVGQQMEKSKYTAPHVTHHDTAEVSGLAELRQELKPVAESRDVRLTYMPFIMKALVAALKEYPYLNASLDEDNEEIVLKDYYNVGVAVATDAGLMVPVVEDVDRKSVLELAAEVNDLASRARDRDLSREEMRGGTVTITNFGAIGGEYATPIINHPEVAIVGLGAVEKRPVVESVPDENDGEPTDEVVARETLPLSLSIDHRVIDGAVAAEFTNTVIEYLNEPKLLLLDA